MQRKICLVSLVAVVLPAVLPVAVVAQHDMAPYFEPLRPFIGKTWKGEFADSTPEEPKIDISRWERALNGQAIRILHSINGGEYGGETMIIWDAEEKDLVFYYFTTGGFYTRGTIEVDGEGKFVSREKVTGGQQGITEVKAVGEILPDGRMRSSSQFLKNGEWIDGHVILYTEAPGAEVAFK